MTLPAIYICLDVLAVVLIFFRLNWGEKFKHILIKTHLILWLILLLNLFVADLKGVLLERILVIAFLLTASMTFSFYWRTLRTWQKVYFGVFLFYPIIAAATFLIDRIMFVVVASPLLVAFTLPTTLGFMQIGHDQHK